MSYFSDEEDERDSVLSVRDDTDDDEPLNPPKKNLNKEQLGDELVDEDGDENINESDDENDDDIVMTDTDGEAEYEDIEEEDEEDEKEEIKQESKKEKEKDKSKKEGKKSKLSSKKVFEFDDEEEEDDDYEDNNYLQKFNEGISENYILNNHPECIVHNYNEVISMCSVIKDANGIIIDDLHKTIPYLTKYERARILGIRAKQINCGATPFIKLSEGIIDGYIIAEMELREKKIPFIIRRPMPNRGSEYWFLKDLEDLSF